MQKNNPIVINVPHSSTYIPESEMKYFTTPYLGRELSVMTDHYCDDLYDAGPQMIINPVSRLVCDPERFRDDTDEIMSRVGMGAVYTSCSNGEELKAISQAHREEILTKYYDRYHHELEIAVEKRIEQYGRCLIIDGHSFYDTPLPYESDQDINRPDICIGTDSYHTSEEIEATVCDFFKSCGYSVAINRPFAGCIVPLKYYQKDKKVSSVMIEINRRLYIDHNLNKTDGYNQIKKDVAKVIRIMEELI